MSKQIKSLLILLIDRDLIIVSVLKIALIFVFVEEEVLLAGIVGPDFLYAFVYFPVVLKVLQVLEYIASCTLNVFFVDFWAANINKIILLGPKIFGNVTCTALIAAESEKQVRQTVEIPYHVLHVRPVVAQGHT